MSSNINNNTPKHNAAPLYSGPVVAATLAAVLGCYTLMISHHVSRISKALDTLVHSYGYWIPGAIGSGPAGSIGSYSGKETLALGIWFTSWLILHHLWKQQDIALQRWLPLFLAALGLVTLCLFHPFIDPVLLFLLH